MGAVALMGVIRTVWNDGDEEGAASMAAVVLALHCCGCDCGGGGGCSEHGDGDVVDDDRNSCSFPREIFLSSSTLSNVERGTESGAVGDGGSNCDITLLLLVLGVPASANLTADAMEDDCRNPLNSDCITRGDGELLLALLPTAFSFICLIVAISMEG